MKLATGGSIGHGYVLQLVSTEKNKIENNSAATESKESKHRFGILLNFVFYMHV